MRIRSPLPLLALFALGAGAVHAEPAAVRYVAAPQVEAAFAKGAPLVEVAEYKVHASRRDGAGQAEVHLRDTDVIHVLGGTAQFVTGGRVVGGASVAPDEIRGATIEGGETRRLSPGDVIVVPRGVPHWFEAVEGPFTYYVVKVTGPAEAAR